MRWDGRCFGDEGGTGVALGTKVGRAFVGVKVGRALVWDEVGRAWFRVKLRN